MKSWLCVSVLLSTGRNKQCIHLLPQISNQLSKLLTIFKEKIITNIPHWKVLEHSIPTIIKVFEFITEITTIFITISIIGSIRPAVWITWCLSSSQTHIILLPLGGSTENWIGMLYFHKTGMTPCISIIGVRMMLFITWKKTIIKL